MTDPDISRLSRLTSIITTMMSKTYVTSGEIMKKFDISKRTFHRDMRTLTDAGVPITFEANKGYAIAHWYKLPPLMFSREESVAFMTAEKFMETMADKATATAYKSATEKIRTILRHADKNYVENIESSVAVLHNPYLPVRQDDLKYLNTIMASINEQKIIHITYQSVNGYDQSQRDIEPLGVYFASSRWYLIAFCHLKNDYRNFRVDKILSVHLMDKTFAKKHPTLHQYLQAQPKEDRLIEVVLKMKKQDVPKLGEQKYYMGFVAEKEDGDDVIMTFMTATLDGFAKAYFIYGDYAEVITPESLKDLIIQIGTKIIHKVTNPF